jgi:hypothetical protein
MNWRSVVPNQKFHRHIILGRRFRSGIRAFTKTFAMATAGVLAITLHPATRFLFTRMARNLP